MLDNRREQQIGVMYGLSAYLAWGFVVIYFKAVSSVPAFQVLAHRVLWSLLLLIVLQTALRKWNNVRQTLRSGSVLGVLLGSTTLIGLNWYVFIWAVEHEQVVQASLGYFINPLVNVLLGYIFLGERLRRLQVVSVLLAATSVTVLTVSRGQLPVIALTLALSFGCYGLLRKIVRADALTGLTVETALLTPIAIGFLLYWSATGESHFGTSRTIDILLVSSGVVTAVPLLLFAAGARRLRLATMGFLQYIAPSMQFLIGLAYGESVDAIQWSCFIVIWFALAIFSADAAWQVRTYDRATNNPTVPEPTLQHPHTGGQAANATRPERC